MGKKNRKKLKKLMRSNYDQAQKTADVITNNETTDEITDEPSSPAAKPVLTAEDHEVKKEIRKILITIGIMVIVIVAVYLINTKSDIILKAGEWIVGKLNLSI